MKKAFLLLADGTLFEGTACGYEGQSTGEVVFNTGMAGYQEVLTDPSYYGQIVTMTYPLVGNYGINLKITNRTRAGFPVLLCVRFANIRPTGAAATRSTTTSRARRSSALAGIDTRRLTRILRNSGRYERHHLHRGP